MKHDRQGIPYLNQIHCHNKELRLCQTIANAHPLAKTKWQEPLMFDDLGTVFTEESGWVKFLWVLPVFWVVVQGVDVVREYRAWKEGAKTVL